MMRHDTPSSVAVVTKMRSSNTIGEDHPLPGIFVFHRTFLVADHSTGKLVSVETPCPFGPRNLVQFSPFDGVPDASNDSSNRKEPRVKRIEAPPAKNVTVSQYPFLATTLIVSCVRKTRLSAPRWTGR